MPRGGGRRWVAWRDRRDRTGSLGRLLNLALLGLVAALLVSAAPTQAHAQWTAPQGALGWCVAEPPGSGSCFADPVTACQFQWAYYTSQGAFLGIRAASAWYERKCTHAWQIGDTLLQFAEFQCESGFTRVAPAVCVRSNENFESREPCCNQGATPMDATPGPIVILDGAKRFTARDFTTADGHLSVDRRFSTRWTGGAGNSLAGFPLGAANWRLTLLPELHFGASWEASGIVGLTTGEATHYRFLKSGSAMVQMTSPTYPIKATDYTLAFVGTWPASNAALLKTKSSWIVRDVVSRAWHFETQYNPITSEFDIARPVRVVEPDGLELVYQYADGALLSITDTYGRALQFEWLRVNGPPSAISVITLPDGTTLNYVYEGVSSVIATPDRLIRVERRQGSTVLDQTSYDYADARYPIFVTGIRDRNNLTRWTVTYDDEARATSSSGPGGADVYTVAYSAAGPTFTRTVTNPLGKSTVYTFTRTSTLYNVKLTSVVEQASTNSPARTTAMTYSGSNYVATKTDPESRVVGFTRDTNARPTQVVEAQGTPLERTTGIIWHANRNTPSQVTAPGLTTASTLTAGSSGGDPPAPVYVTSQAFAFSGAPAAYTVPGGVTTATVRLWGGAGGTFNSSSSAWSGSAGYLEATFAVSAGDTLTFEVGGGGEGAIVGNVAGGAGGWPDGGGGSFNGTYATGGGGGSTRFYINGALKAVAGGGGGSGGLESEGAAGAGGGLAGLAAAGDGGTGGSQSAGGVDSSASGDASKAGRSILAFPGAQRTGGWGNSAGSNTTSTGDIGGGGGGGYWGGGGGGGSRQSGGGGSSWVDPSATATQLRSGFWPTPFTTPSGLPNVATGVRTGTTAAAVKGGDGYALVGLK